ncbi:hypothetical protein [Streptomyces sp. NPDC047718]|uniref:hypothetical protein n=1 Tax=Streptomyces sp. NPDC047718 TaxID=3155479 RepID=UPI0033FA1383
MTGRWEALASAQRTYSGWIHLYDTHPTAVIELVEEAEDGRRVLKRWTRATGEVTK